MSAPATRGEWAAAFDRLGAARGGRGPDWLTSLGIDPEPLRAWCADDAVDTMTSVIPAAIEAGAGPAEAIGSALATHMQMGIEMGLWLAQTGQVTT
jgi:hypothetical protein